MTTVRHPYKTKLKRVQLANFEQTRTKQSFKKECDINFIMEKYQKTGAITHFRRYAQEYGFATPVDLKEAMDIVAQAEQMYAALPSGIRKRFPDPAEFLEFVQDPDNEAEMIELGLANLRHPADETPTADPDSQPDRQEADTEPPPESE